MPPIIDKQKCVNCKHCYEICPLDVFRLKGEARTVTVQFPEECWHCAACAAECPKGAIEMRYPISHMMFHVYAPGKEEEE